MNRVKILRASAGSGKTYRLAYEYIKAVVARPSSYSSILAVTFTNKATEEMKSRILEELNTLAHESTRSPYLAQLTHSTGLSPEQIQRNAIEARSLILHDYSHFAISTIDKFFQKIVRGFIKELGLDFGYTVELNNDAYLGEAVDRLLEKTATDAPLAALCARVIGENIENERNWDIRPELIRIGSEITKERYMGSAKSPAELIAQYEIIAERVAKKQAALGAESDRVLALMESHGLQPSDFKGGKNSFVRSFAKLSSGDPIKNISKLHQAADSAEEWYTKTAPRRADIVAIVSDLMQITGQVNARYEDLERDKNSFELLSENFNKTLLLGYISAELQQLWTERNRLPIHQTTRLIGRLVEHTAVPFIYEKAGNRFDRYMIDEFQDTSRGQWQNFLPLLDDAIGSARGESVMLIGDVKQAIYRWRGGDWDILARGAIEHYGDQADHSEQLNTNWRSRPEVVEFNNRLIRSVVQTAQNPILTQVYDGFEQTVPDHKTGGYVRVAELEKDDFETVILSTIADAIARGYRQRDIALLVRGRKQGSEAADILLSAGHSIIDQESLQLTNSQSVRTIVSLLKYALNRADGVSLAKYNRMMGNALDQPFGDIAFIDSLLLKTPVDALDSIIVQLSLGSRSDQVSYLQAFYQVVLTYCTENVPDLAAFVEWWDQNGYKKSVYLPSSGDAITILTIHKSKGLQFPCVIIPRCEWEIEPTRWGNKYTTVWASTDEPSFAPFNPAPLIYKSSMAESHYVDDYVHEQVYSLIDSINMLYVAVTRAESELYIYYTPQRGDNNICSLIQQAGYGDVEVGIRENYTPKVSHTQHHSIKFDKFIISPSAQKIRTSWDSQRYYEDGGRIETPITYGVLMHQIFSKIGVLDDLEPVIAQMVVSGELTAQRSSELRARIAQAMTNPTISSWFAPHWKIYNENAIISPGSNSTKRPDRVITHGQQAVVIDYKFGTSRKSSYKAQIQSYMDLLRQMGYTDVTGYLWYVEHGDFEQV